MIVVSDTSPLTNLAAIGRFELLREIFRRIDIPDAVYSELRAGEKDHPGRQEVEQADWVKTHPDTESPLETVLRGELDRGEAAALALAVDLNASLILLDEREARRVAARLGLHVMGVLGVLLRARSMGLVDSLEQELDSIRSHAGFYVSDALYAEVLRRAGESPP